MITKTFAVCLPLLLTGLCIEPTRQMAQERGRDITSPGSFIGTWKGVCADGKEFVVLIINQSGADIVGTVSIANMQGEGGQCATVMDPPTEGHAMKISDAKLRGAVLAFNGSQHAEFEMTIVGTEGARLKFLGTPDLRRKESRHHTRLASFLMTLA